MTTDEIITNWQIDSKIDKTELADESIKIGSLHCKYVDIYLKEKRELSKLLYAHKKLNKLKTEYYSGKLSKDELAELNWPPFLLRVIKQDIPSYIESDDDIIKSMLAMGEQEYKVDLLQEIIKSIHSRGWNIKNAIDFLKFTNGLT